MEKGFGAIRYISIYIYLLFGCIFYTSASTPVLLRNNIALEQIGKSTFYLEDASLQLTIEQILLGDSSHLFTPNTRDALNFSSTSSAYWVKFEIKRVITGSHFLEVGSAFNDHISYYEINHNGVIITKQYAGDDFPFSERLVNYSNFLFPILGSSDHIHTIYLRVQSTQPLFFPLKMGRWESFMEFAHRQDYIQGIYFGFMMLIFLYNLFLYLSTKENIYLYYTAYILCMGLFMASVFGYLFEYLWPGLPIFNQYVVITSGLTMVAATKFTQHFLSIKDSSVLLHYIASVFSVIGLLVCALVILDFKILGLQFAQGGLLLMGIYFLFLGIRYWRNGFSPAKYYLLAWGVLVIGIIFAILESLNVVPVMPYVNAMQIGSGLEAVLLSFALGDKINTYKNEIEDAQMETLELVIRNEKTVKQQNVKLEAEVEKRTLEIARQNEELLLVDKEKDTLINVVAHDLRTPLNHIKGFIQLITMDADNLNDEQRGFLNEMNLATDRLSQMTSQILDVNAIAAKKINLSLHPIDLREVVKTVMEYFSLTSRQKGDTLKLEYDRGSHIALLDRNYVIQILENLVSNAIKYTEPGSEITLSVKNEKKKVLVEIIDHGPGISVEDQAKLFTQFQTLTARPTAGESSTGLGLSIVKKYIEAMNGSITCESELGKGAKFIVSFDQIARDH